MSLRRVVLVFASLAAFGCGPHRHKGGGGVVTTDTTSQEDQALVDDTEDTTASSSQGTMLGRIFAVGLAASDPIASAKLVEAATSGGVVGFSPPGCATGHLLAGNGVRVTFAAGCSGPFGLVDLSGSIDGTFVRQAGKTIVRIANVDLAIDGRPIIAYSASEEISGALDPDVRHVTWNAHWEAVGRRGLVVAHTASLDIEVDLASSGAFGGHCSVIDGTTSGTVGTRGLDTVIERYASCPGECPTDGTITSTGRESHRTITLLFDGSDVAHVTRPNGTMTDVPLACGK